MKKLFIAMLLVIALILPTFASAVSCGEGSHWEAGEPDCNWVCSKRFWGICIDWDKVCVPTGQCVADPVEEPVEEPVCEEEEPVQKGGGSWLNLVPRVNDELYQNKNEFTFLTTQRGIGGLLFKSVNNDNTFAVDAYGGIREEFQYLGANDYYGYDYQFEGTINSVVHRIRVDLPAGEYKVRAYFTPEEGTPWSNGMTFGVEHIITIK